MAAGRPSVVTEKVLIAEVVEREECGLAVPYSGEVFLRSLTSLQGDPLLGERLGRNGLAAAKREYNWPHEAAKLVALYESLAGGS